MPRLTHAFSIVAICAAAQAPADTLFTSDFDGNTVAGTNATSIDWTTNADTSIGNGGDLTSLNGLNFGVLNNNSTANNITVNNNLNIDPRSTQRGYSLEFTLAQAYDLTELTVLSGHINANGGNQTFDSDLNYDISNGGGSVTSGAVVAINYGSNSDPVNFVTSEIDLTGVQLAAGTYTLSIGLNNLDGGGAFAIYDGVTLEGNLVPEPTTAALALAGLALLGTRRRRS